MKRLGIIVLAASFAGLATFSSLGTAGRADEKAVRLTVYTIKMKDNTFDPATLTVAAGDQVRFENVGANTHTATSDDIKTGDPKDTFNVGRVKPTQAAVINMNKTGDFKYHCEYHNGMSGTITVQ
jgi:plastocyanin